MLAAFPALNLQSPFARTLIDAAVEEYDQLWDAAEGIHKAAYPSTAFGASLDEVAAITGTLRRPATRSTVVATVTIDPGTYPAQSLIASVAGDTTARFRNRDDVTNPGGTPAPIAAVFESEQVGPVDAPAGSLTVIAEPTSGWIAITNPTDATPGKPAETDAELRARREQEVVPIRTGTLRGLRSGVSRINGVIETMAFENVLDVPSGGLPAHSFEIVLWDGPAPTVDNDVIARAIFERKGSGITAYGATVVQVEAEDGLLHDVGFTRATGVQVWIEVDLAIDPDTYAGDAAVEAAIVAIATEQRNSDGVLASQQGIGDDVIASRYLCAALDVAGVLDVLELRLGTAPSPVGTANIPIGAREIGLLDTSRIAVNVP